MIKCDEKGRLLFEKIKVILMYTGVSYYCTKICIVLIYTCIGQQHNDNAIRGQFKLR